MSEGNGFAGRDAFLKPALRRYREFEVDGIGKVRIQSLNEHEKAKFESDVLTSKGKVDMPNLARQRRRLIALCVVDASGARVLTDRDVDAIKEMDGAAATRIYDECSRHCGFDKDDLDNLAKNSESLPV